MQRNKNMEEKKGLKNWFRRLYGLEDEKQEDLEFMYSLYANSNEKSSRVSNIIFLLVIGIFSILLLWAAVAEIDELARGNGKVIPTDKIQTVQSLDGGIISEIFIKDFSVCLSIELVGSSNIIIFGSEIKARARVTDCLSPPDNPSPLSPTIKS